MGAKAPRLYYVTQAEHSPPKFVVITNAPDSVHFSYQRFVVNQLRKHFGFEGVPVRVIYKAKRRTDRAERMIARAEATAEVRPRQKINATTRARAKARVRGPERPSGEILRPTKPKKKPAATAAPETPKTPRPSSKRKPSSRTSPEPRGGRGARARPEASPRSGGRGSGREKGPRRGRSGR